MNLFTYLALFAGCVWSAFTERYFSIRITNAIVRTLSPIKRFLNKNNQLAQNFGLTWILASLLKSKALLALNPSRQSSVRKIIANIFLFIVFFFSFLFENILKKNSNFLIFF